MKESRGNKHQDPSIRKHLTTSNSVDKNMINSRYKRTIESAKINFPSKIISKRHSSIPKNLPTTIKSKKKTKGIAKKTQFSLIEMETARILIELVNPMLAYNKNVTSRSTGKDNTNKSNREILTQGIIYKKIHPVHKSNVYGLVVKQFSKFLPKRIKFIPTQITVNSNISPQITNKMKLAQITELKAKKYLSCVFINKHRNNALFRRINKAFDEELIGVFLNYNSLYSMYFDSLRHRDIDALNCTLVTNKTNSNNSTIQGGNNNITASKVNMKKLYDIGLTPFPAKKHKSKRFDYEFITASRAANLIRRIEYSNYLKYSQSRTKDDLIALLNTKAVILQRWWRRMLINNTFYYKIITIQRMYRGHITKAAYYSAIRLLRFHIPFYSKLLFVVKKTKMNHMFNKLLCYSAYLYQYSIIHEKQLVIIGGFNYYKQRHRNEFSEIKHYKAVINYGHMKKWFYNIDSYKFLIDRVQYLQKSILLYLRKRKSGSKESSLQSTSNSGKVINVNSELLPTSQMSQLIDGIAKYVHSEVFRLLKQFNKDRIDFKAMKTIIIPQKEIMIKLINRKHLRYSLYWMKKKIQMIKLRCYLSMKLINASIKLIVFIPVITLISKYTRGRLLLSSQPPNRLSQSNHLDQDMNQIVTPRIGVIESNGIFNSNNVQMQSLHNDIGNKKHIAMINKIPYLQLKRVFDIYYQRIGKKLIQLKQEQEQEQEQEQIVKKELHSQNNTLNNTSLLQSPLFPTKNRYAIYCSLRKIIVPLIQKENHAFYIYFTKFVINSHKRAIVSLRDSNSSLSFKEKHHEQSSNQEMTITSSLPSQSPNSAWYPMINSNSRCNYNKLICFIIINHIYHPLLKGLFTLFKHNTVIELENQLKEKERAITAVSEEAEVKKQLNLNSKIVELCLRNLIKASNTCKRTTLSKYFLKYHSIVYLTQLNDLYLQSTSDPSSDVKLPRNESNHELPSNILRINIRVKKTTFENRLQIIIDSLNAHYNKALIAYFIKWKKQIQFIKINSCIRVIQRNWRLKLSPKQKLYFLLVRIVEKK